MWKKLYESFIKYNSINNAFVYKMNRTFFLFGQCNCKLFIFSFLACCPTFYKILHVLFNRAVQTQLREVSVGVFLSWFAETEREQKTKEEGAKDWQTERQTHVSTEHIAGIGGNVSCQAKVADLRHPAVSQQNVSSCKIPVDALRTQTRQQKQTQRWALTQQPVSAVNDRARLQRRRGR